MGRSNRQTSTLRQARGLFLILILAFSLLFVGCSPKKAAPATAALIDKAFAGLFPDTASLLARRPGLLALESTAQTKAQTPGQKETQYIEPASLSAVSRGLILDWQIQGSAPQALIASPLAAKMLGQSFEAKGGVENRAGTVQENSAETPPAASMNASALPRLVIPFGKPSGLNSLDSWSIGYDYPRAYGTLGRKAAQAVVKQAEKPSSAADAPEPYCLVLFQENILRGSEALEAFKNSFTPIAGEGVLIIELLPGTDSPADLRGAFEQALSSHLGDAQSEKAVVIVLGIDDAFSAQEAARGSKGSSTQEGGPEALFMADCGSWDKDQANRSGFAWRIEADGRGLAKKTQAIAARLAKGREAERISLVPLRILAGNKIF